MKRRRYQLLWSCLIVLLTIIMATPTLARIEISAQVTDPSNFQGIITGRFFYHDAAVDVYVFLVTTADTVFSLCKPVMDGPFAWLPGVHVFSSHPSLSIENWGYLFPVDFSPAIEDGSYTRIFVLVVRGGTDPLETANWIDCQGVNLLNDPSERRIGQSFFLSPSSTDYREGYGADAGGTVPSATPGVDESEGTQEEAEKPDIVKISGNRLYYANGSANRLQLIDLTNPSQPALLASLLMEGIPQELYVLGDYCYLLEQRHNSSGQFVQLRIYNTTSSTLQEVSYLNFPLVSYKISRRLGERIFLVAISSRAQENECCRPVPLGDSIIYSIDISNPEQPSILAQEVLSGYDPTVHLDDHYLILLTQEDWATSVLHIFDLLAPGGAFSTMNTLQISGQVPSEYHIHTSDSFLYVVYRQEGWRQGSALAIYDLSDFNDIREVGRVDRIAPGEELYATRFNGNRAYVVTYERQDPLWVIDLQYPTRPTIIGELEVPGWSEYMEFFDDKLLAVGYDDGQGGRLVSVALFSVADPENPTLLDRVTPFSGELSYTYSEAIEEERAFYVNYNSGLILLPISYHQDGDHSCLEIIQLAASQLAFDRHYYVESSFRVRRGTETDLPEIVVGIGDAALNTIDITPASGPVVVGGLRLARNVEQAVLVDAWERLWTLGGDFYCCNPAELLVFDTSNLDSLLLEENTGLVMPVLIANESGSDQLGVLFSNSSSQFGAIEIESMRMGRLFDLDEEYRWSLESPLVFGRVFYVAKANYPVRPWPVDPPHVRNEPTTGSPESIMAPSPMPPYEQPFIQWHLKRFDCTDINVPVPLSEISIPGRPLGFTENGKLICVEEQYYYPYYIDDTMGRDIAPQPEGQSLRLNVLAIVGDQAILEATRLFTEDDFRNPQVIMDDQRIFLTNQEENSTTVMMINPTDLSDLRRVSLNDRLLPIKAFSGKLLLTTQPVYYMESPLPLGGFAADIIPEYWGEPEFLVYDLNKETPHLLLRRSGEYINTSQVAMTPDGLYVARGYGGIHFIPYEF